METGKANQMLCDNLEGWDGGGGGGGGLVGSSRRMIHVSTCDWFMFLYGRIQHNIVKQLSSN